MSKLKTRSLQSRQQNEREECEKEFFTNKIDCFGEWVSDRKRIKMREGTEKKKWEKEQVSRKIGERLKKKDILKDGRNWYNETEEKSIEFEEKTTKGKM